MECRERKPKGPCIIHVARVKQILERAIESNKRSGNGKCMKARKVNDSNGSEACTQGLSTTYLWSSGGEKGGIYFGVPAQTLLGKDVLLG